MAVGERFGVDFDDEVAVRGLADDVGDERGVPWLVLERGVDGRGVGDDFVEVGKDVEAAAFDHGEHLLEVAFYDVAEVAGVVLPEVVGKAGGTAVAVHVVALLVGHEVYGADAVVERHALKEVDVCPPVGREVVDLHASQYRYFGFVQRFESVDLLDVCRHVGEFHVALRGDGDVSGQWVVAGGYG